MAEAITDTKSIDDMEKIELWRVWQRTRLVYIQIDTRCQPQRITRSQPSPELLVDLRGMASHAVECLLVPTCTLLQSEPKSRCTRC